MKRKVLIQFAHPSLEKSRVNRHLFKAISDLENVTVNDLYELYPDFEVDIQREQALLTANDILILHHPMYWYSAPPLMKQWLDLVLEHGWAYGSKGNALQGKWMLNALSTGGGAQAYCAEGNNRFSVRQFMAPFEQTARLCKMVYLPPYVVHGTHRLQKEDIVLYAKQYVEVIHRLQTLEIDLIVAEKQPYLNGCIGLTTNNAAV